MVRSILSLRRLVLSAALTACAALVVSPSWASWPPATGGMPDNWSPTASYSSLQNNYIGVGIGWGGDWSLSESDYLHQFGGGPKCSGRFDIWTTGGDPTVTDDDYQHVIFHEVYEDMLAMPGDRWGAWWVMVDNAPGDWNTSWSDGVSAAIWGSEDDGAWQYLPYTPTYNDKIMISSWYPNDIPVKCELETKLLRDTVRFKWTITNEDVVNHQIGLRVCADVAADRLDGGGYENSTAISVPGHPLIREGTLLMDRDVPDVLEFLNSVSNPVMSVRATFNENDATRPDVVGVDDWYTGVASDAWNYLPDEATGELGWSYAPMPWVNIPDYGYGAFWKPITVLPGHSREIVHYIGLACATSDFTKPTVDNQQYLVATQSRRALQYLFDTENGIGSLSPDSFDISAYVENTEKYVDMQTPSFTLMLPSGLELDPSENSQYTKSLSTVTANSEGSVTWKVRPVGHPTGLQTYSIAFGSSPMGSTSIERTINIPATERQDFTTGWQMISVPFNLLNTDPKTALGLPDDASFWRYDAYSKTYKAVDAITPGEAYWLKLSEPLTTTLVPNEFEPISWAGIQGYQVQLRQGWNLVGNPFVYAFTMGELRYYYRDYGSLSYDEAIDRGLISTGMFWWDPLWKKYNWSNERSAQLKPWQGYWIKALKDGVTVYMTPAAQIGAGVGSFAGTPPNPPSSGN